MKKCYVPMMVVINNAYSKTTETYDSISKNLKSTKRFTVLYDEMSITEKLDAYKQLESLKVETEATIREKQDKGSQDMQKLYAEYQSLSNQNADKKKLEACTAKMQNLSAAIESEIKGIQGRFQVASMGKFEEIKKNVEDALKSVCSKLRDNIKKEYASSDKIVVDAIDKTFVRGLEQTDLDSIDITNLILDYLKEKGKISKNSDSKANTGKNNKSTLKNKQHNKNNGRKR